ncbi:uncharacterized protein Dana_GF27021 [Drosophila ananassae]|uniref:Uncharacterized protein n=1 Tax=Drosophila ananassae TaxID=7217 RepID=A0A0P8XRY7_DROAN|nr:uncharacterized protein Dana_GF27021 [Drosophila ananassae]
MHSDAEIYSTLRRVELQYPSSRYTNIQDPYNDFCRSGKDIEEKETTCYAGTLADTNLPIFIVFINDVNMREL